MKQRAPFLARLVAGLNAFRGNTAARRLPEFPAWAIGWPLPQTQKDLDLVDAFEKVPVVGAAVRKLADDQASIPRKVWIGRGEKKKEMERVGKLPILGGNLADLLAYANPEQTGTQLISSVSASIVVNGVGYFVRDPLGQPNRPPLTLWNFPGQFMRAIPGAHRGTQGYEYRPENGGRPEYLKAEDVIPFRSLTLSELPTGSSWLGPGLDLCTTLYYGVLWYRDFYKSGGIIAGTWHPDEDAAPLTPEEVRAWAFDMQRQTTNPDGTAKRWSPVVAQGMTYLTQGMKISEMQINEMLDALEARIARLIGIPPTMLGMKEGEGSLSTSSQTEATQYWLGTQKRLASLIDETLSERLAPVYGTDVWVEADFRQVPAVAELMLEREKALQQMAGRPTISVDEARTDAGRSALGGEFDEPWIQPPPQIGGGFGEGGDGEKKPKPDAPRKEKDAKARLAEDPKAELRRRKRVSVAAYRAQWEALVNERLAEQRESAKAKARTFWAGKGLRNGEANGHVLRLDALDVEGMIPGADPDDEMRARALVEKLLRARMAEGLSEIEAKAGIALEVELTLETERAARFIELQVDRAIAIPDETTRRMLRGSIADAVREGGSLEQVLASIDEVMDVRQAQALTIARTETAGAYGWASLEAYHQSGVVSRHTWLTSHSGTGGRHSENPDGTYNGLDGQSRGLGDYFNVGKELMRYPGDVDGPAGESINCVCTTIAEVDPALLRARAVRLKVAPVSEAVANRLTEYFA